MKKIIIVACSKNNVIGVEGKIPWHSKADFKHFKETTMGYPILMGRKTFESIGKPLPGRKNVVITRNPDKLKSIEGITVFDSIESAIEAMKNEDKIFIIGGGEIYNRTISVADELLVSRMPFEVVGDTYFPEISKSDFDLVEKIDKDEFVVEHYVRKSR